MIWGYPYFWKHLYSNILLENPSVPPHHRSAEANQVEDAAPGEAHLRFAGHRKWAGAYAVSKRGLEKLTKSGYAQCTLGPEDGWNLDNMKIVVTILSIVRMLNI